jgi:hypothetical protein
MKDATVMKQRVEEKEREQERSIRVSTLDVDDGVKEMMDSKREGMFTMHSRFSLLIVFLLGTQEISIEFPDDRMTLGVRSTVIGERDTRVEMSPHTVVDFNDIPFGK